MAESGFYRENESEKMADFFATPGFRAEMSSQSFTLLSEIIYPVCILAVPLCSMLLPRLLLSCGSAIAANR